MVAGVLHHGPDHRQLGDCYSGYPGQRPAGPERRHDLDRPHARGQAD